MPEAKIGYFVDVGMSYHFSRLKNGLGLYLGLTSTFIKGEDVVKAGFAHYYVNS